MNVHIKTIPHKEQRYDTVGDWFYDKNGDLQIRVSKMSDGYYEQLVALHELAEALLCDKDNIDEEEVTRFDISFTGTGEPGDDIKAPYYWQHQVATGLERQLAALLEVDWAAYEKEICGLN
jgi:hypothetical protein